MPKKKYRVDLRPEERKTFAQWLRSGKAGTRQLTRARILLKADDGLPDEEIAAALDGGTATVGRTRQRLVEENLEALNDHTRPGAQRQLTSKQRSPDDRGGLHACPQGARPLDAAAAGGPGGRTGLC
jgi:Homeodomain-like domain-containing protein